jgi:hypothetical protein
VKTFFTAPTAIRAIRKEDPDGRFIDEIGTGRCQAIFLAGERADPETIAWAEGCTALPVIDHWWQTELGWPAIASCFALGDLRRKRGSAGFPVPGYDFTILSEDGHPVPAGESGAVAIRAPCRPGPSARCGTTRPVTRRTSWPSPASTRRAMPDTSTPKASCTSWGARTTSSTSPGTACPPARWSRSSPGSTAWPNAR